MLDATYETGSGFLATLFGLGLLFVGASNVFNQLQISLNHIWGVRPKPQRGMFGLVRDRLLSVGMVLVVGFLLLTSLILSTALSIFLSVAADLAPAISSLLRFGNTAVSFVVITALFAMIYKFLPNARVAWGDVWVGAAFTSALFGIGQWAIGIYLTTSGAASAYGAAGSLVVILLWIYYSANILLLGAEFTQVYARHFGSRIQPGTGYKHTGVQAEIEAEAEQSASKLVPVEDITGAVELMPGPEPRRAVVVNVPGEKANQVWFAGFLGGLALAAAGLIAGVFFGRDRQA